MHALTRTYITSSRTNYVDVPETPPSRPGAKPLVIMLLRGFFWRSTGNHYHLILVMRALATSLSMYVRTYRNSINKCIIMIPTAVSRGFLGLNMTPIWKYCRAKFFLSSSPYIKIRRINGEYSSNYEICALLACLPQHPFAFTLRCGTDMAGRGALEPPPEDGAQTKLFDRDIPVSRIPH